jgi:hypothetical protein
MKEEELILIDNYFQQKLTDAERVDFENKLKTDQEFAQTVAFYSHTKAIERDHILKERHKEWTSQKPGKSINFTPKFAIGLAASILLLAGIWFFEIGNKKDSLELATNYIQTDLATLPLKMDATEDSLELGKKLYNNKNYKEAFELFNTINKPEAKEYQGLSALQSGDYLRATALFEQQAQNQELLNNKGKFYLALTYLKMGEKAKGEALLKEVVDGNLAGKGEAEKILE